MTQDSAPAGWYDDPAGTGGRRYWDGRRWTERTQDATTSRRRAPAPRRSDRDRLPDGYMLLNGDRVPLGQTTVPHARPSHRGLVVAVAIVIGLMVLLAAGSALVRAASDESLSDEVPFVGGPEDVMVEVESRHGDTIDIRWSDGTSPRFEDTVNTGWSATTDGAGYGAIAIAARPSQGEDFVTCRITDSSGAVLAEEASEIGGFGVDCRVDRDELP